ncbi:MAG: o-succinylbenzoate synthase [Dehalococcoidia bacterium]|nr:o-succinylbenzoate synthase [Dehalococcoidia bacterium]
MSAGDGPAQALPALVAPRLMALRWRPFRLPLRRRFEAAHGPTVARDGVLVELLAADGAAGVGEASPTPSLGDGTAADVLALLDRHAGALVREPDAACAALTSGPGVAALRCAIDTALLDLAGQARGLPVAALLAAMPTRRVRANAVIGLGAAEAVAAYAREAVAAGYATVKLKVGAGSVDDDIARVAAVRAAVPGALVRLDANGAWSEAAARDALARLAPLRIELIEQPVAAADVEALARLRRAAWVPVAADEAAADPVSAERVLAAGAADLLVLKPMRLGGIRPALALARQAAALGVGVVVTTTFDSSVGTAAALQLAAALDGGAGAGASPGALAHGLGTGDQLAADVVARTLVPARGALALPAVPGLGVAIDAAALAAVATGPWREQRL